MKRASWVALAVLVIGAGLAASCRTKDIRTVTVSVPEVKNAQCETVILNALKGADGVVGGSIRFGKDGVTVTYDSMKLALKNLEFVIADAGFTANDTPANPAARAALPPECK